MTHSIDAPFPPPTSGATAPSSTPSTTTTERAKETKDVAVDEARNVGQTAAQAGSQVASVATDQAKQVAQETQRQAKDLLDQGRTQVKSQVVSQQQKAGQSLSSLAQELRGLADGTSAGAPGPARDLLQQASSSVENFASMLQNRRPDVVVLDVSAEYHGIAFLRALRDEVPAPHPSIVALCPADDPAAAAEAMLLQVEAQLVKPVDAESVLAAVEHVLLSREHAPL